MALGAQDCYRQLWRINDYLWLINDCAERAALVVPRLEAKARKCFNVQPFIHIYVIDFIIY